MPGSRTLLRLESVSQPGRRSGSASNRSAGSEGVGLSNGGLACARAGASSCSLASSRSPSSSAGGGPFGAVNDWSIGVSGVGAGGRVRARDPGERPRDASVDGVVLPAVAVIGAGLVVVGAWLVISDTTGFVMGLDDLDAAPWWVWVGFVGWLGIFVLLPIWSIRLGRAGSTRVPNYVTASGTEDPQTPPASSIGIFRLAATAPGGVPLGHPRSLWTGAVTPAQLAGQLPSGYHSPGAGAGSIPNRAVRSVVQKAAVVLTCRPTTRWWSSSTPSGPPTSSCGSRTASRFAGSMQFVYIHVWLFAVWMLIFEQSPWPTLTLVVSLEAIFLSTFVMIGQNRQASFQQAKADHDFVEEEQELRRTRS